MNNWWVWEEVNIHVQALKVEQLKYPEVTRRDAVFTVVNSAEAPMEGEGGCQSPLPQKALFVLLNFVFFQSAIKK